MDHNQLSGQIPDEVGDLANIRKCGEHMLSHVAGSQICCALTII